MHRPLLALLAFVPMCPQSTDSGSAGSASGSAPSTCATEAPPSAPYCGETVCSEDVDCSRWAGNYCAPSSCQYLGCLRGKCQPVRGQGQLCERAGECYSGCCTSGVCAPVSPVCQGSDAGTINLRDAGGG